MLETLKGRLCSDHENEGLLTNKVKPGSTDTHIYSPTREVRVELYSSS